MINVSFNKRIFPDFLKIPNIIPAHKIGEKLDSNNYRPISLLSNINKLHEKAMYIWLINFIRKNKEPFSYQSGRNNYSTNHALTSLTKMIRNALDNFTMWCLRRPAESLWHCQSWYPCFKTKPLHYQNGTVFSIWKSLWVLQKACIKIAACTI